MDKEVIEKIQRKIVEKTNKLEKEKKELQGELEKDQGKTKSKDVLQNELEENSINTNKEGIEEKFNRDLEIIDLDITKYKEDSKRLNEIVKQEPNIQINKVAIEKLNRDKISFETQISQLKGRYEVCEDGKLKKSTEFIKIEDDLKKIEDELKNRQEMDKKYKDMEKDIKNLAIKYKVNVVNKDKPKDEEKNKTEEVNENKPKVEDKNETKAVNENKPKVEDKNETKAVNENKPKVEEKYELLEVNKDKTKNEGKSKKEKECDQLSPIDKLYNEIEGKYAKAPEETIKKEIENLSKEIEGKKLYLKEITKLSRRINLKKDTKQLSKEGKEKLEKDIKQLEERKNNLEGYRKNKKQIEKIKKVQKIIETKLDTAKAKEKNLPKLIEKAEQEIAKLNLKDTTKMDNFEYKDFLSEKEPMTKTLTDLKAQYEKAKKDVIELQGKVGKCDLAWETLFANKGWDEIFLKASKDKQRFTREKTEKQENKKGKEKNIDEQLKEIQQGIGKDVDGIMNNNIANPPAKDTTWNKIKRWFKQIPQNIKNKFIEKPQEETKNTEQQTTSEKRDQFLENLRGYADESYRREKEEKYIEIHKAKQKKQPSKESEPAKQEDDKAL